MSILCEVTKLFICENNSACNAINLATNDNKPHETLNPLARDVTTNHASLLCNLILLLSPYYSIGDIKHDPVLSPTLKFSRKHLMLFLMCGMFFREPQLLVWEKRKRFTHPITIWRMNRPNMIGVVKNKLCESVCE